MVDHLLPEQNAIEEHQPAMPWLDIPAFLKKHITEFKQGEAPRALLFLILTAARSGEVRDLAERTPAHTVANKVEAAYHRTDLMEQRRPMMAAWAEHVCGTLSL